MSAASAESAESTSATPHAGPGRVLGTLVVLALFGACAAWLVQGLLVAQVDGAEKQREYFGADGPPLGLALESALRLPTGDAVVRFVNADAAGGAPAELLLVEYRSRAAVLPLFRAEPMGMGEGGPPGMRMKEWERDPSFEWKAVVKRGDVAFGDWTAKLVVERSFRKGGGWSEEARADLSSRERPLVAFVRFPDGVPYDEPALRALLAALVLPAHEDEAR
jgi:hypothetical protein